MSKQKAKPKANTAKVPKHVPSIRHMVMGPGPTVTESDGTVWRFGFNTQNAKARLEELFRAYQLRTALHNSRLVGGEDGEEIYKRAMAKVDGGYYSTFERGWHEMMASAQGSILYILSLIQHYHPDATEEDAKRIAIEERKQVEAAMVAISPDFYAALATQRGANAEQAAEVAVVIANKITQNLEETTEPDPMSASTP